MDLLDAIKRDQAAKVASAIEKPVVFISANPREVAEDEIFAYSLVDDLKQLVDLCYEKVELGRVRCMLFNVDNLALVRMLVSQADLFPVELVVLEGLPNSEIVDVFKEAAYGLATASYDRVVGDVVEVKRQAALMTDAELENSMIRREQAQRSTKQGKVRPLLDFDHGNPQAAIVEAADASDTEVTE